jgi:hypothetical protein
MLVCTAATLRTEPTRYSTAPTNMLAFRPNFADSPDASALDIIAAKKKQLVKSDNSWLSNEQYEFVTTASCCCTYTSGKNLERKGGIAITPPVIPTSSPNTEKRVGREKEDDEINISFYLFFKSLIIKIIELTKCSAR